MDYLILNNMTSFYSTEAGEYAVLNPYLLMGDFASGAMGSTVLAGYESLNPGPFMQIDEGTLGAQLFGGLSPNELKWRARAQDALMGGETPRISEKAQAAWEMVGGGFRTSPDTDAPNPPGFTDGAAGGKVEGGEWWNTIPSYLKVEEGKVGGKIEVSDYTGYRQSSVKNPEADAIMLGKYTSGPDSYIAVAGDSASYFDLGKDWNVIQEQYDLTDAEMFEYFNQPFLDDALNEGKTICFSHDPTEYAGTYLAQEWEYIKETKNLTDDDLQYEGGIWYVK